MRVSLSARLNAGFSIGYDIDYNICDSDCNIDRTAVYPSSAEVLTVAFASVY